VFKSNINKLINNSGKIMGLFGIMATLAVMLVGAPAASANRITAAYGKITVYASNAATGTQISQATVLVLDTNANVVAKGATNERGEFASYVPIGTFTVKVSADGYKDNGQQASVKSGQSVQLKIALQPSSVTTVETSPVADGKLAVYALDATTGDAITEAAVLVLDVNANPVMKGVTDSRGYYAVMLRPGTYKVIVSATNYGEYGEAADIVPGEATMIKAPLMNSQDSR